MDYKTIPALAPATFTPYTQVVVVDIDGDTYNEVIVLSPDIGQLAVIHQVTFNQISPNDWTDQTTHWWNLWTTPQQGTIPGGWTVGFGDTMLVGDFNGDGHYELFLHNTISEQWGIVSWDPVAGGLKTICYQPNGCPNWKPQVGDQFVVFPKPNGSASDGLLAYNNKTYKLSLVTYHLGVLSCDLPDGPTINNWTFDDATHFYGGFFTSTTVGSFLLLDTSDAYIACLTWNGVGFHVSSGQNETLGTAPGGQGQWYIRSDDVVQCGDVNGDGYDEVVVYNPAGYLGAWQWVSKDSQFQTYSATSSIAKWTIGGKDQYCVVPVQSAYGLFGYNSETMQVSMLSYDKGAIQCDYVASTLNTSGGFPVSSVDQYYCAAPKSPATPRLFGVSPQSAVPGLNPVSTLLALLPVDTSSASSINVASSVALPAPGWTPALLAQAPNRGFPAFSVSEQPVYVYVSNLFPEPTNGALRNFYTTSEWAGKFAAFSEFLRNLPNPPDQNFSTGDWDTVRDTIQKECNRVDTIYTSYNTTIPQLASNLALWQESDVATVKANIQNSVPTAQPSTFVYWLEQGFIAALWGGGSLSGDPLVGAICSVFASLLGSALAVQPATSNPLQVAFDQVDSVITGTFTNTVFTNCVAPGALLSDAIKMRIFDELSGTTWLLPPVTTAMMAAFESADRRTMYSELMPCMFQIAVMHGISGQTPVDGNGNPFVGNNPDSYSATAAPGGGYNVNALFAYVNGKYVEPSAVLTNDLKAIGVVMSDLLSGTGIWSRINRTVLVGGGMLPPLELTPRTLPPPAGPSVHSLRTRGTSARFE